MSFRENVHYQFLREEIDHIPAISAHDHLAPERAAVGSKRNLFGVLLHPLVWADLVSAGGPPQPGDFATWEAEAAWAHLKPWLDHLQETAVFQVQLRGLRELFGFDEELDDSNWQGLNERVRDAQ